MEYLRVGLIAKPQGIVGEVKITPLTDDNARFHALKEVYVENGVYEKHGVMSVRVTANGVFIKLDGVDERNTAEALRGKYVCVPREQAAKLPEGRHFICDLENCEVFDDSGNKLGILREVMQYPANDVYSITGERSFLVPVLKKLIKSVDVESKKIVLDAIVLGEVAVYDED